MTDAALESAAVHSDTRPLASVIPHFRGGIRSHASAENLRRSSLSLSTTGQPQGPSDGEPTALSPRLEVAVADTAELTLSQRRQALLGEVRARWCGGGGVRQKGLSANRRGMTPPTWFCFQIQELQTALSERVAELASLG